MRLKSAYLLTLTVAVLIFSIATDQASSHRLSSLAVRAFDGAVGTVIELVKPPVPEKRAERHSITSVGPARALRSGPEAQSPLLAANPIQTSSFETTLASGDPFTVTERNTRKDEDVASRVSGGANFGVRGVRPAFGGGSLGSAGNQDASIAPAATTEMPADTSNLRLDGLMDLVASDLDRDYGAPAGASSLNFTKSSTGTAATGSPSSSSSASAPPERGTSPETATPAGSIPNPTVQGEPPVAPSPNLETAEPALVPAADFSTSLPGSSGNPAEGSFCRLYRSTSSPASIWTGSLRPRQFHRMIWSMTL